MTTRNIESVYTDFRAGFENNPNYTIDFYTKNALFFNNINSLNTTEELRLYIELIWQYLNAIYIKGRFNDTVDKVNKTQSFIDSEINKLNANNLKDEWYQGILLFKGMASYRLRDYETATNIFRELVQSDINNENYKNWLNYSRYGERSWLVYLVNSLCIGLGIVTILFKSYFNSYHYYLGQSIRLFALAGIIGVWVYDYYIKRSFRKSAEK